MTGITARRALTARHVIDEVACPYCDRKPGFPCQDMRGVERWGCWIADEERGGWRGGNDKTVPHRERRAAAVEARRLKPVTP